MGVGGMVGWQGGYCGCCVAGINGGTPVSGCFLYRLGTRKPLEVKDKRNLMGWLEVGRERLIKEPV